MEREGIAMIIPTEKSHPFGCYMCGWVKLDREEECLCDLQEEEE